MLIALYELGVPFESHVVEGAEGRTERARPSIARVVDEARPFRELFPLPWPADQDALGRD